MRPPPCPAVAWAVWAVWTIRAFTTPQTMKARDFSRAFFLSLHTGFSKEGQSASIGELELTRLLCGIIKAGVPWNADRARPMISRGARFMIDRGVGNGRVSSAPKEMAFWY
jgi:hypothetical protein